MNINDKEELIAELEEHLAQVLTATQPSLLGNIPEDYITNRIEYGDLYGVFSQEQLDEKARAFIRDVMACS